MRALLKKGSTRHEPIEINATVADVACSVIVSECPTGHAVGSGSQLRISSQTANKVLTLLDETS